MNLCELSDKSLSGELDRRNERVQRAWNALQATFGKHLERLETPEPPVSIEECHKLFAEMEASERSVDEVDREWFRRRDVRLGA